MEAGEVVRERFILFSDHFVLQVRFFHLLENQLLRTGEVSVPLPAEVDVFIHGLFQFFQLIVSAGLGLGRRQVGNENGAASPFGLDSFSGDGDVVGVHIGQIPKGQVRIAALGEAGILSRQPFQAPMGSYVDQGVRLPFLSKPLVKGQIVVGGRGSWRVVDLIRIFPKSPGRLDGDKDMAVHGTGD